MLSRSQRTLRTGLSRLSSLSVSARSLSPSFSSAAPTAPAAVSATGAAASPRKVKTGIAMLNMGGPETVGDVESFLVNLFSDNMIINLGKLQPLGAWAARRRAPKIVPQYAAIGGSPLRRWTQLQGDLMCARLDVLSPATAPHKAYPMFRYAAPFTEDALAEMRRDGVERAVAFPQYPMYSCTTTGSSLAALWRAVKGKDTATGLRTVTAGPGADAPEGKEVWSVIDRWHEHPTFIQAVAARVKLGMDLFPPEVDRSKVLS